MNLPGRWRSGSADRAARGEPAGRGSSGRAIFAGLRQPVVLILLLIAFFSAISGKPLDGLLMLLVAVGLGWDAGRRPRAGQDGVLVHPRPAGAPPGQPAPQPGAPPGQPAAKASAAGRRRILLLLTGLAAGAAYAVLVGSFSRYSWPATAGVIGVGVLAVTVAWPGPVRGRPVRERLPFPGTALWGGLLVAGGLWELTALLQQPSLTVTSYAHPTISALTDPLLGSHPGRTVALAIWLVIGWLLIER